MNDSPETYCTSWGKSYAPYAPPCSLAVTWRASRCTSVQRTHMYTTALLAFVSIIANARSTFSSRLQCVCIANHSAGLSCLLPCATRRIERKAVHRRRKRTCVVVIWRRSRPDTGRHMSIICQLFQWDTLLRITSRG